MKKYTYVINRVSYEVTISEESDLSAKVEVNGELYTVEKQKSGKDASQVASRPRPATTAPHVAAAPVASAPSQPRPVANTAGGDAMPSPLPGVVTRIAVSQGQQVKEGDLVVVLESMKMENELKAPRSGRIVSINCGQGQQVIEGDILLVIGD